MKIKVSTDTGFNISNINFSNMLHAAHYERSTSHFSVTYDNGFTDEFFGKDFSYNKSGMLTAGTITKWVEHAADGSLYATLTGLKVWAGDVWAAAKTSVPNDDENIIYGKLSGNDKFIGGAGDDRLTTGDGNDSLTGGLGADDLYGGHGADKFINSTAESNTATFDWIGDFSLAEGDKIKLSKIDANGDAEGQAHFTFIDTNAFHQVAGELRVAHSVSGQTTYVLGDTDGDGVADLTIALDGNITLTQDSFML